MGFNMISASEVYSCQGSSFPPGCRTTEKVEMLLTLETLQRQVAELTVENAHLYEHVLAERDRALKAKQRARKELARRLHDGTTQQVSAIVMGLDYCQMLVNRDPAKLAQEIAAVRELADQAVHQIRTILFELRPLTLETQGLIATLQLFLERRQQEIFEGKTRLILETKSINADSEISRLDHKVENAIFAIVQEAVNQRY